jgi:wyosine [tRNA(Phe)-imidazoG37] synthetase (radical SAM superfamily)
MPETSQPFRHLFGPVLSRRLGRSLGVDLIPSKTCTYDCVYCQVGRTTLHTLERREYVPLGEVLDELDRFRATRPRPDYITLAGSGEPTLHSGIGTFLHECKARWDVPLCVITNGSLLWDPAVRADLLHADLVIPSLDAATPELFQQVNQPVAGLAFDRMVDGLAAFRETYPGTIWLEVLLVDGLTASEEHVRALARHIERIRPDRVHLTTTTRPVPGGAFHPVSRDNLEALAPLLGDRTEVVAGPGHFAGGDAPADIPSVLSLLRRHPCSIDDLAAGLGSSPAMVTETIQHLLDTGEVTSCVAEGLVVYMVGHNDEEQS